MADNNKENKMSIDDFDFAHEEASDDTPMLVNYLVTRLQQAMGNPALQGEVQQQLHAYGILPPFQQERGPERFQGETSKRRLSIEKGVENPYQELKQLVKGKPSSKKKGHAQHERSPSREREESESQDESMEDVAPRRRRAQRSPTPTKRKWSPHSPHRREFKREEKNSKKKERKRSPSSPSSSPSSSSDEGSGYSSQEKQRRGHRRSYAAWKRSSKLKKFKEGGKNISFLTYDGTFGAIDKVLAFIQQFDAAFGDEGFTESSKLRHVAMHFQKSARQWYTWVSFLKLKSEAFGSIRDWKAMVEKEKDLKVKSIRSDRGGEFLSENFAWWCKSEGIRRQLTTPYTPSQNGVVERKNMTIMEMARAMLAHASLPRSYWAEACNTAVYIQNRSPTHALQDMTPFQAYYGRKPTVSHFRVFGCSAFVHISKELDFKSRKLLFLGYSAESDAYRLYDPDTRTTTVSRDVVFDESFITSAEGEAAQLIPILPPPSLPDPPASPVITPSKSHPVPPIQPPDVSPDHALSDSDSDLDVADATPEVDLAPPRQEKRIPGLLYSTIEKGDLFNFDEEVESMLEVLVGRTLEQTVMEVMEEKQLANLHAYQEHFEQIRAAELVATQRMEAAERRINEEKKKRVQQEKKRLEEEEKIKEKTEVQMYVRGYLRKMMDSIFHTLQKLNYFYDPVEREVEEMYFPFLSSEIDNELMNINVARSTLKCMVDQVASSLEERNRSSVEKVVDRIVSQVQKKYTQSASGVKGLVDNLINYTNWVIRES
ncbi:hypothetical protein L7F22_047042 [Adiantum nelumboides]|nr:hypothetical protein [Adiantum nelumboides]